MTAGVKVRAGAFIQTVSLPPLIVIIPSGPVWAEAGTALSSNPAQHASNTNAIVLVIFPSVPQVQPWKSLQSRPSAKVPCTTGSVLFRLTWPVEILSCRPWSTKCRDRPGAVCVGSSRPVGPVHAEPPRRRARGKRLPRRLSCSPRRKTHWNSHQQHIGGRDPEEVGAEQRVDQRRRVRIHAHGRDNGA